jgi:release factor glutamine methyltransferase
MNIKEMLKTGTELLPGKKHEVQWLISHYMGVPAGGMIFTDTEIPAEVETEIRQAIDRRRAGEPLQYITGHQGFMDFELYVDPRVLIPRWDSEVVVEQALTYLPPEKELRLADICTGSGAYALAFKYYRPQASVFAVDISADALAVAEENSKRLGLAVEFLQGDLLAPLSGQFDLIAANPPYIRTAEIGSLDYDVQLEPRLALDGGADGLDFYRRLVLEAKAYLKPEGYLVLEIGHDQQESVCELLKNAGYQDIAWGQDYGSNPRWVSARR